MLCQMCHRTLQGKTERINSTDSFAYIHHESAFDLQAAAENGCHLCTMFWSLLSAEERSRVLNYTPDRSRPRNDHVQITTINSEDLLKVTFPLRATEVVHESEDVLSKSLKLFPYHEVDHGLSHHVTHANTAADANFTLAKKWLNHCTQKHSICAQLSKSPQPWYPTRLLEVAPQSQVRLRITNSDPPNGPYLSLSHCWGSAQFLKLTKQNIDSLQIGISNLMLPKTFKDAIYITRKLGVNYLWIDALCIIQDSDDDWRREAATMGNVYQKAFCNLAATRASDSGGGCFWDRNPLLAQACKVDFTWELPYAGSYYCVDGSLWPKNIGEAPLNRRAWVTQERILSPRILHYGEQQIFWECYEMEASESFPSGIPESPDPMTFIVRTGLKRLYSAIRYGYQTAANKMSSDSRLDGYAYWDGIVDVYTRCSLTRQSDKLIALSGMAKEMSIVLNDKYLAGLWEKNLPYQLLWSIAKPLTDNKGNPCFRPQIYQAPTWSWASMDGHIVPGNRIPGSNWELLPKLLKAQINTVGNDPTGQIIGARLHARGVLRLATPQCLWSGRIYQLILDGITQESSNFWPDELLAPLPDQMYCFPLLNIYWDKLRTIDGLVLTRTGRSNEFKRIGKFRYQDEENCWLLMKRQRAAFMPKDSLYEDLEDQVFTII